MPMQTIDCKYLYPLQAKFGEGGIIGITPSVHISSNSTSPKLTN